jgi:cytochrome c oxidase assembly factor CtaG
MCRQHATRQFLRRLAVEIDAKSTQKGILEHGNIGILHLKCIIPLFHDSNPVRQLMSHGPQFEIEKNFQDPEITALLQSWTFEPWIVLPLLLAGSIYLRGWRELHRRLPHRFGVWRLIAFQGGLFTLFLSLASPLHELAERLLQFHMIQHLVLMMVVPPLLLLGAPILPLLRGWPRTLLQSVIRPLFASAALQRLGLFLTHPLVCLLAFTVSNVAWHVPSLYELALRSEFWHEVQHVCFLSTGLLFWWPVVQPWPSRLRWPRWTMIPYLLFADIQNTALSAFLIFSERVLYPTYATVPRLWGISVLDDQAAAGAIMWVPGSVIFLVPVALLSIRLLDASRTRSAMSKKVNYEAVKVE